MYIETSKLEKVLGAKLLLQNVLKRRISTESFAKHCCDYIYITLYLKCKNIKATPHNKRVGLQ